MDYDLAIDSGTRYLGPIVPELLKETSIVGTEFSLEEDEPIECCGKHLVCRRVQAAPSHDLRNRGQSSKRVRVGWIKHFFGARCRDCKGSSGSREYVTLGKASGDSEIPNPAQKTLRIPPFGTIHFSLTCNSHAECNDLLCEVSTYVG